MFLFAESYRTRLSESSIRPRSPKSGSCLGRSKSRRCGASGGVSTRMHPEASHSMVGAPGYGAMALAESAGNTFSTARVRGRNGRERARRSHRRTASAPDRSGRGKAHGSIPGSALRSRCARRFSSRERRTRPAHRPERSCPDPSPTAPTWRRSAVPRRGEKSSPRCARRFQREPCCPR